MKGNKRRESYIFEIDYKDSVNLGELFKIFTRHDKKLPINLNNIDPELYAELLSANPGSLEIVAEPGYSIKKSDQKLVIRLPKEYVESPGNLLITEIDGIAKAQQSTFLEDDSVLEGKTIEGRLSDGVASLTQEIDNYINYELVTSVRKVYAVVLPQVTLPPAGFEATVHRGSTFVVEKEIPATAAHAVIPAGTYTVDKDFQGKFGAGSVFMPKEQNKDKTTIKDKSRATLQKGDRMLSTNDSTGAKIPLQFKLSDGTVVVLDDIIGIVFSRGADVTFNQIIKDCPLQEITQLDEQVTAKDKALGKLESKLDDGKWYNKLGRGVLKGVTFVAKAPLHVLSAIDPVNIVDSIDEVRKRSLTTTTQKVKDGLATVFLKLPAKFFFGWDYEKEDFNPKKHLVRFMVVVSVIIALSVVATLTHGFGLGLIPAIKIAAINLPHLAVKIKVIIAFATIAAYPIVTRLASFLLGKRSFSEKGEKVTRAIPIYGKDIERTRDKLLAVSKAILLEKMMQGAVPKDSIKKILESSLKDRVNKQSKDFIKSVEIEGDDIVIRCCQNEDIAIVLPHGIKILQNEHDAISQTMRHRAQTGTIEKEQSGITEQGRINGMIQELSSQGLLEGVSSAAVVAAATALSATSAGKAKTDIHIEECEQIGEFVKQHCEGPNITSMTTNMNYYLNQSTIPQEVKNLLVGVRDVYKKQADRDETFGAEEAVSYMRDAGQIASEISETPDQFKRRTVEFYSEKDKLKAGGATTIFSDVGGSVDKNEGGFTINTPDPNGLISMLNPESLGIRFQSKLVQVPGAQLFAPLTMQTIHSATVSKDVVDKLIFRATYKKSHPGLFEICKDKGLLKDFYAIADRQHDFTISKPMAPKVPETPSKAPRSIMPLRNITGMRSMSIGEPGKGAARGL